jgi:TRAP-type uncharacterized transport system substrate-binding protein
MRFAAAFLSALIFTFLMPSVLRAAEFGTRDEAVAMVRRVQEKFKKDGPATTLRAINAVAPGFVDRDLFPFVHKLDGSLLVAASRNASMLGKSLYDLKDQDGKFFVQEFVKVANGPAGRGWVDYRFVNPKTNTVEDKSAWIERMGDYLVGVGIYKNEQPNENTIGLISGSPNSDDTYLQMAYDLADVLNDGDNLRILPIAGIGGPRNIRDVRYLRGVDIGLTQTSILNNFRRSNQRMGQVDDKIVYIAKLFNEEVHLIARPNITSIQQLKGLKVNLDTKGSGTSYSMRDLFNALEIDIEEVGMSQLEAIEKVRSGEIAATAVIAGKPVRSMLKLTRGDRLHLVQIPYPAQLASDYLPTTFSHDDYPELIAPNEIVDTVAVGAVLIAYNWQKTNADRYRRVQRFVEAFFPKINEFWKPPHHPKWREVNIAATLPGWNRFEAAQAWLDNQQRLDAQQRNGSLKNDAPASVEQEPVPGGARSASSAERPKPAADPALYEEFNRWLLLRGR